MVQKTAKQWNKQAAQNRATVFAAIKELNGTEGNGVSEADVQKGLKPEDLGVSEGMFSTSVRRHIEGLLGQGQIQRREGRLFPVSKPDPKKDPTQGGKPTFNPDRGVRPFQGAGGIQPPQPQRPAPVQPQVTGMPLTFLQRTLRKCLPGIFKKRKPHSFTLKSFPIRFGEALEVQVAKANSEPVSIGFFRSLTGMLIPNEAASATDEWNFEFQPYREGTKIFIYIPEGTAPLAWPYTEKQNGIHQAENDIPCELWICTIPLGFFMAIYEDEHGDAGD